MEIHNHSNNHRIHFQAQRRAAGSTNAESGSAVDRTAETQPARFRERLEGDAKVRERLLVEIKAKVHAGEYATRAAAEEAAQHLVD